MDQIPVNHFFSSGSTFGSMPELFVLDTTSILSPRTNPFVTSQLCGWA